MCVNFACAPQTYDRRTRKERVAPLRVQAEAAGYFRRCGILAKNLLYKYPNRTIERFKSCVKRRHAAAVSPDAAEGYSRMFRDHPGASRDRSALRSRDA